MQVTQITKSKPTKINNLILYILPSLALFIIVSLFIGHQISIAPATSALDSAATSTELSVQAASLSVDVSSNSVILDIAPTYEGVFEASDPLTVNVDTTNTYGYNLMMTTTTTTSLVSTVPLSDGSTYPTIETLADDNSGSGYDSVNFPTNRWGYTANGSNYLPVAYDNTLRVTTGQNNPSDRSNIVTFGTKLNTEIATGNYNITLNFIATANAPSNLDDFEAAFIFAGKTKYNGYYKMQDMTANICSYVATPTTTTSAPSTQLIDIRDNKIYWVSKLKDGNCWMTQNLDFDINDTTKQYLTSEYTDLVTSGTSPYATADGYSKDANGKITWTPVRNTIVSTTTGASFSWPSDYDTPYTLDLGDWYYRSDYYNNDDCGDQGCNYHTGGAGAHFSQTAGANGAHSHVGNYYNWSAAVASNNTNGYNSGTPSNSICPKGWKLPANGGVNDNGTYSNLNKLYNGDITTASELGSTAAADKLLLASPLYFVRAGNVWSSALHHAGRSGLYWSSTVINAFNAYTLYFRSSGVWPSGSNLRRDGRSVRCLASTSISDITYMQEFATMTDAKKEEVKATMTTGTAYQLIDNRDNEVYNVAKLADGNVWLLDNLRLDPATLLHQLTPANTNMDPSTPFTLPESSTDKFNDDTAGWTTPGINTSLSNTVSTNGVYQGNIGVFYNYCAASAGTICAAIGSNNDNASYDICPASWRMPTGGESGEYQDLYAAYDSDYTNFQTALRTPLSGYFGKGSVGGQGSDGYFWSSTKKDGDSMYYLGVGASNVSPQYGYYRRVGYSVRCLLK